jgi:pilin isopeptide linkage protein
VSGIEAGQTLTYQIPSSLVVQAVTKPTKLLDTQTNKTLGSFVIDDDGLITVTIDDSYFNTYAENGSLTIHGFNLFFYGSFSDEVGQQQGSGDNVISFEGSASSGGLTFTIPFDYKNDLADVQIEKTGVFDPQTRTISYTVTVTAPDDNTENAYNVKVTDEITSASEFIEPNSVGHLYRNVVVTNGEFDRDSGVWTISGEMKPGQTETLTYDLVVSKKYFTENTAGTPVSNKATVTFNESGKHTDTDVQETPGTVLAEKKAGSLGSDENGTFITYTLTITAYNQTMKGIEVSDAFDTPDYVKSVVADDGYTGTVTIGSDNKSFTWTVDELEKDKSAILTYKAYVNPEAWQTASGENFYSKAQTTTKNVTNTATVTVNNVKDVVGAEPIQTDQVTETKSIEKTWMQKTSNTLDSGLIQFTVTANAAPSASNVVKIWDEITGGTYEDGGVITLIAYDSSINRHQEKKATIKLSDVKTSDTRWEINLAEVKTSDGSTVDLSGTYYYELTYNVNADGVASFNNTAGLGMGSGIDFKIVKTVQGSEGWERDRGDFDKSRGTINYKTGEISWTAYLRKTVPEGLVFYDHASAQYCYENGYFWFDDDAIAKIEITQGNNVLVEGVDYSVVGDTDGITRYTPVDSTVKARMQDKYSGYKITFSKKIEASKSQPVTIKYVMKFDTNAYSYNRGDMFYANYCTVSYPVYGELVKSSSDEYHGYWNIPCNVPLYKKPGSYNATDGTITWEIEVNRRGTVGGNATLVDLLPAGLTFVSAEITSMGGAAEKVGTTINGGTKVEAKDCSLETVTENGKNYTKVTLSVENLSRFKKVDDSGNLVDTTDYTTAGQITVTITAKVNPEYLVTLEKATTVTNKAILTGNDYLPEGGVSATGDATITATGTTVLSKSQATTEAPAYVQFALDINSNALDLVEGDGTLTIQDVMGEGMTMATHHEDCFKVYDVTDVEEELASGGESLAEQAKELGEDITKQCSWTSVSDSTSPTYEITVPDGRHVVIVYWAVFSGVTGQKVSLTNNAYFSYKGKTYSNNGSKWNNTLQVSGAGGDAYTYPYFYLQKQDQWGNNVSGATFAVYEKDETTGEYTVEVARRTTVDGLAYIGYNPKGDDDFKASLKLNTVYGIKEIYAPAGYTLDSTEHYFEFVDWRAADGSIVEVTADMIKAHQAKHPENITVIDLSPGSTYTVTNTFAGASAQIPVAKTINGENLSSTTDFSFTLKQVASADGKTLTVYTDEDYKGTLTKGLTKTITGSGTDYFDTLYFKDTGTYTFELTEDSLSSEALNHGFSEDNRDKTEYTVTVVVAEVEKEVKVTSITFVGGKKNGDILNDHAVPTFNNLLTLKGTLALQVKKTVTGRTKAVQAGEFSFNVMKDGAYIKGEDGEPLVFTTSEGGMVNISIPITQEDIGTQDFVITEVVPTGDNADKNISYDASPVIATVTIGEVPGDNGAEVAAISEITYTAEQTEKGVPLMVNKYSAKGEITLTGTKIMTQGNSSTKLTVGKNQFSFTVKENNDIVATGATESDGSITFTKINYIQSDVGEHVYTITENTGKDVFVKYSEESFTVKVLVTDNGDGTLTAAVEDSSDKVEFHNVYTLIVPSGIRLDLLPYMLILILALGCGALVLRKRKHMRG